MNIIVRMLLSSRRQLFLVGVVEFELQIRGDDVETRFLRSYTYVYA